MSTPAYCRPIAHDAFRHGLGRLDEPEGLAIAAAAIALHENPELPISLTLEGINKLADAVQNRLQSDTDEARLAHLHDVLFDIAGFHGDTENYYDAANSYLPLVLRTKRGIPISLTLVYKLVAERVGLRVEGVNAPGHFLACVACRENTGERSMYVDPFYGGGLLTIDEAFERLRAATGQPLEADAALLRPASPRAWLSRMLLNLQAIFAHGGNQRDLFAMQELQACLTELDR